MDQDIAVRLANEGVPVRAIARAVQAPSADIRVHLESARAHGDLIDIPCDDWPAGYPREQRLLQLSRLVTHNKPALQMALRSIFKLAPVQVPILLLLLSNDEVARHRLIAAGTASLTVNLCRLRRQLSTFGLKIETMYGYGYFMPAPHRRKALDLILETAVASSDELKA